MSIDPRNEKNTFTISHIFDDNINRVWYCLRNVNITSIVEPSLFRRSPCSRALTFTPKEANLKATG